MNQFTRDELIDHYTKLMCSPNNMSFFENGKCWDEVKILACVDEAINAWNENKWFCPFVVSDAKTNELIGNLDINHSPDIFYTFFGKYKNSVEIGYILDEKFWGKGYGTEIAIAGKKYIKHIIAAGKFESLDVSFSEIVATAHPENKGSIAILRKTLKRQEDSIINCYGQPRSFFFKPLKNLPFNQTNSLPDEMNTLTF